MLVNTYILSYTVKEDAETVPASGWHMPNETENSFWVWSHRSLLHDREVNHDRSFYSKFISTILYRQTG